MFHIASIVNIKRTVQNVNLRWNRIRFQYVGSKHLEVMTLEKPKNLHSRIKDCNQEGGEIYIQPFESQVAKSLGSHSEIKPN